MQNTYNIHYYYWHIYKEKKMLGVISLWSKDTSCYKKLCKKKKKQIVMNRNSKLNDFKFVTLMGPFKNVKANEIVP
jgi:hypothetical protein